MDVKTQVRSMFKWRGTHWYIVSSLTWGKKSTLSCSVRFISQMSFHLSSFLARDIDQWNCHSHCPQVANSSQLRTRRSILLFVVIVSEPHACVVLFNVPVVWINFHISDKKFLLVIVMMISRIIIINTLRHENTCSIYAYIIIINTSYLPLRS